MKKIYNLLLLAVSALAIVACSDDDDAGSQYLHQSQLKVTESKITFSAKADSGSVTFTAPENAEPVAVLNSSWATAAIDGNTVHVAVKNNPGLEGRSAQLTIKAGEDSANVTIQQRGMEYGYDGAHRFVYNDSARTVSFPLTNIGGNVESSASVDWAVPTVTENGVDVALADNTTGHIRQGNVYIGDGPYKDTIQVVQGQLSDIINKYYVFAGYDLTQITENTKELDELFTYMQAAIVDYKGAPVMYFPDQNFVLPVEFNDSTLSLKIKAGEQMGLYYNYYYVYSSVIDYGFYSSFNQQGISVLFTFPDILHLLDASTPAYELSMTAPLAYDDENQMTFGEFGDNDENDDLIYSVSQGRYLYNANVFAMTAFGQSKEAALSAGSIPSAVGDLIQYAYPTIIEGQLKQQSKAAIAAKVNQKRASDITPAKTSLLLKSNLNQFRFNTSRLPKLK